MKDVSVGFISEGYTSISYDKGYSGLQSCALYNFLYSQLEYIKPRNCIGGAAPGADTVWAWVCESIGKPYTCILPCQDYGKELSDGQRKELEDIKKYAKSSISIIGTQGWSEAKENARIQRVIDRSDILFILHNEKEEHPPSVAKAEALDKEIILINLIELI